MNNKDSIAIEWTIDDVLDIRPDLSRDEARQVLREVDEEHDAEIGINIFVIQDTADRMFEEKTDDDLKTYSVKIGRRIVEQCYIEIEAVSEQKAIDEVDRLITLGEFHDVSFTTTAITGEEIFDVHEKRGA